MPDNGEIIELKDFKDIVIPEQKERQGKITLNYGINEVDTIKIEGSLTLNEACFLHKLLGKWIDDQINEMDDIEE